MTPEDNPRSRHPRRNLAIVIVVLALVAALAWWLTHREDDGRNRWIPPATTVGVAKAAPADVPVALTAIGTVQPVVAATVRPQLSGVIFSLNFTEGQRVSKGQLLAQIDPRPYRLALAQAQGTLARDQAALAQARSDLGRYQTLLAQDSIARQQVDTQAALVKQNAGTVEADRAAVGTAQLNVGYTAITAPVSGRIGLRQVDVGNYVTPGDTNGIAMVTVDDPIDVSFALPQDQLPQVQARARGGSGLAVTALDQAGTAVLATGRFLTFDNQIDAATGTVRAKARFGNGGARLFPNQFVNVSLLVNTLRGAVTVPVAAVRTGSAGSFVFTLQPGRKVKLVRVTTGPTSNGRVVITKGIANGDTVISEGADKLEDGADVTLPGDKPAGGPGGGRGGHRRR